MLQEGRDFVLFVSFAQESTIWQDLIIKNKLGPDRTLLFIFFSHLGIHPFAFSQGHPSLYSLDVAYSWKEGISWKWWETTFLESLLTGKGFSGHNAKPIFLKSLKYPKNKKETP